MPSSSLSGGDFETSQPPYGPAPAPLAGAELPSFRFPLGDRRAEDLRRRHGQGGDGRRVPGLRQACRCLYDARARRVARAALACQCRRMGLCDRRALPRHHHRSREPGRDRRFRSWRCLVFPARSRPLDPRHWSWRLHLRARLRQRLFLRVRHLLDQRLGRPHARRDARQEFRRAGSDLRQLPQERGLYRPRSGAAGTPGRSRRGHSQRAAAHPSLSLACATAGDLPRRQHARRVDARLSDLFDHDRRAVRHQAWRHARAALASERRRVAVLSQGQRPHDRVRLAMGAPAPTISDPAMSATCRKAMATTSRTPGEDDLEIVLAFNNGTYQSISITAWLAANPSLLLGTNFRVPGSTFAAFPKGEVVMPD